MTTRALRLGALSAAALVLSGCGFGGLNSHVLPGAKGSGSDGYEITVELPTAANLVPNSEVKVGDVTVGTVRSIGLDGWHATAQVSVENSVRLPAGTTARVGQKSLLGAEYLELRPPGGAATGAALRDGGAIPLANAGNYPETEEVLSALAVLLNGGGLGNVETIVRELADAFGPAAAEARQLVGDLSRLTSTITAQRSDLLALISAGDRLGARLAGQTGRIARSLDSLSVGIAAVSEQTPALTRALTALHRLSVLGTQVVARDGDNLRADLRELARVVRQLDAAGDGLPASLDLVATILFPISRVGHVVKGDYLNFAATVDLTLPSLQRGLLPGGTEAEAIDLLMALLGILPAAPPVPAAPGGPTPGAPALPGSDGLDGVVDGLLGGLTGQGSTSGDSPPSPDGLLGQLLGGQ